VYCRGRAIQYAVETHKRITLGEYGTAQPAAGPPPSVPLCRVPVTILLSMFLCFLPFRV
jgi:hypothetical protein